MGPSEEGRKKKKRFRSVKTNKKTTHIVSFQLVICKCLVESKCSQISFNDKDGKSSECMIVL